MLSGATIRVTMLSRREQLENELLVLRCRQGDSEAFSQLVDNWQERLWRYAYRLTLSDAAACDIAQETWCAVVASLRNEGGSTTHAASNAMIAALYDAQIVPEPTSVVLLMASLIGLAIFRRRLWS